MGFEVIPPAARTAIKSVQPFSIGITGAGVLSGTATITAVVTAKSVIIPQGCNFLGSNAALQCTLVLTNATTVTATITNAVGASTITFVGTVVEFI